MKKTNKNYEAPKAEMIEVQMPVVVMSPLGGNPGTGGGGGGVGARNNACGTKAGTGSNGGGAGGYPCYNTGNDGTANTGGGGGGAASCKGGNTSGYSETGAFYDGGTGGSGVIIIRNKR